jgi:GT2 family glycosyltransferase
MPVSVVIPNWNGLELLQPLFIDLQQQTLPADEILVVDNASTDGSDDWAEKEGARVIRNEANRGFAFAVNRGVACARSETIAVLNNDLRLNEGWLETALKTLHREPVSFVVGKVLQADRPDTIDATYDAVCKGGTAWRCGHGYKDGPMWSEPRVVYFPPFTGVLFRKEAFLEIGGLDETLESYLEDVEFGLRCASKGYTGRYEPSAVAYHLGSATLGRWHPRTVRQISRNQLLLVSRHYSSSMLARFGWRIAVAQLLWGLVAVRHGAGVAWCLGKFEGLRRFRSVRGTGSKALLDVLEASESEIRRLQGKRSGELYWRLYFALT